MARSAPRGRGRRALVLGAALCIACGGSRVSVSPAEVPAPAATTLRPTSSAASPSELVLVPGGALAPGGAETGTVASFELGRTEVTVAEYRKCVEAGACQEPGPFSLQSNLFQPPCLAALAKECNFEHIGRDEHPVNCVTFAQADSYCRWRNQRLPSSAEWEAAARGAGGRAYPWGSAAWSPERANLCDRACVAEFDCPLGPVSTKLDDRHAATAPVGTYPAGDTPEGVADLVGNVSEFTSTVAQGDGVGTFGTQGHIARGGSWATHADVAFRAQLDARDAFSSLGFRCARDTQPLNRVER